MPILIIQGKCKSLNIDDKLLASCYADPTLDDEALNRVGTGIGSGLTFSVRTFIGILKIASKAAGSSSFIAGIHNLPLYNIRRLDARYCPEMQGAALL